MSGWRSGSVILLAALLGLGACGGGDDNLDEWAGTPASQVAQQASSGTAPGVEDLRRGMVWKGEFTIAIEVWDNCGPAGELVQTDRRTRTESFSFATASPVDYGPAARETNAFFISAGTDPNVGGVVGLALQSTGVIALPGQEDDPYILQFWQIEYDDGHLSGRLYEDGREMGLDWNRINDDQPLVVCQPQAPTVNLPYPMKEGTTIDATIDNDRVSMVIVGGSHDDKRRWRVVATASRAG
jgi:hypothetical protein